MAAEVLHDKTFCVWSYSLIKDSLNKGEKRSIIWDRRILGHRYTKASKNPGWMGRKSNKTSLRGLILSPGTSRTVRGAFHNGCVGQLYPLLAAWKIAANWRAKQTSVQNAPSSSGLRSHRATLTQKAWQGRLWGDFTKPSSEFLSHFDSPSLRGRIFVLVCFP